MDLLRRYPESIAWVLIIAYVELVLWLAGRLP